MSLNIKNERVHQLAKEAARVTGKSLTGAIEEALERLLRDYGADPKRAEAARKVDAVRRIVAEYQADLGRSNPGLMTIEDLYDESTGLPR